MEPRSDDSPGDHAKNMGKKLGAVLLIVVLLAVAGGFFYWRLTRRAFHRFPIAMNPRAQSRVTKTEPPAPPSGSSAQPSRPAESPDKKNAPPTEPGYSPRPGESLEYVANLAQLNSSIADLKTQIGDHQTIAGKNTWHLQAFAHTNNPYRMVFELDDQFDSYSDVGNMTSLQYEMHLSERGQKAEFVQRMMSSPNDPAPPGMAAARVLPGTRDPLGMLQYLRGVDWAKTREVRSPVYDGHKLYDVRAVFLSKGEHVAVPAGSYTASKIEIRVFENGAEMKDAHFLLYLANDAARTPVLMEAVLPVATVRLELAKAKER
jgi:hypothetical protein